MDTLATRRHYRAAAALAALLVLLAGITVPSRFAGAADDNIAGDYSVTLVYSDIPTDLVNGSMGIGHWRISFSADGTFEEERLDLGTVMVTGTYELDGKTLTVTDTDGLLSCGNPAEAPAGDQDVSTGTYTFKLDSRSLTLTPQDEPCPLRRAIFSTRAFTFYVACLTTAINAAAVASPVAAETPEPGGIGVLGNLGEIASPVAQNPDEMAATPSGSGSLTNQIDDLLKQMTACWATGDPARFLPLLSNDFQGAFLNGTEQQNLDALNSLKAAMQIPFIWERAGDIDQVADDEIRVVVRLTAADQEEFARYIFLFQDGTWRWDGTTTG